MRMVAKGEADRSNRGMDAAISQIAIEVNQLDCARIVRRTDEKRKKGEPVPLRKDGTPRKVRSGTETVLREPPSYRQLQRWLALMKECDWAPEALRDNFRHCGNRTPRLEPEAHELLVETARKYATQARPVPDRLYEELIGLIGDANAKRAMDGLQILTLPSKRRFKAEIMSLDKFWVYSRRHTLDAACRKFAAAEDGPAATRIGERIEMDEWQVSLQTLLIKARVWKLLSSKDKKAVKRARWWLYVAIDRASRCVLGMRLVETPRASEAVATIRMIISDKSQLSDDADARSKWLMSTGIGTIVTDWGSAFRAEETRRVVRAMGATFDPPPVGKPHLRGVVERIFSTTETRFMGYFAGRTFSNVVQLGDYNAAENASIPLDVLARSLVRYVVDDYHQRPHPGLGGETPYNAWLRLRRTTGRYGVPDTHRQRAIFGIEDTCKLDNSGVTLLGLRYQNREVYEWFTYKGTSDVTIRIDPEDIGYASVKLGEDWVTVPCRKPELRGVRLHIWKEVAADLSTRYADEAALSRSIVLQAVKDFSALADEYRREAGIVEELDTPESLRFAREALSFGFSLPEWDDDAGDGDLMDGIIPVTGPSNETVGTLSDMPSVMEAEPAWRMGNRSADTR